MFLLLDSGRNKHWVHPEWPDVELMSDPIIVKNNSVEQNTWGPRPNHNNKKEVGTNLTWQVSHRRIIKNTYPLPPKKVLFKPNIRQKPSCLLLKHWTLGGCGWAIFQTIKLKGKTCLQFFDGLPVRCAKVDTPYLLFGEVWPPSQCPWPLDFYSKHMTWASTWNR